MQNRIVQNQRTKKFKIQERWFWLFGWYEIRFAWPPHYREFDKIEEPEKIIARWQRKALEVKDKWQSVQFDDKPKLKVADVTELKPNNNGGV